MFSRCVVISPCAVVRSGCSLFQSQGFVTSNVDMCGLSPNRGHRSHWSGGRSHTAVVGYNTGIQSDNQLSTTYNLSTYDGVCLWSPEGECSLCACFCSYHRHWIFLMCTFQVQCPQCRWCSKDHLSLAFPRGPWCGLHSRRSVVSNIQSACHSHGWTDCDNHGFLHWQVTMVLYWLLTMVLFWLLSMVFNWQVTMVLYWLVTMVLFWLW